MYCIIYATHFSFEYLIFGAVDRSAFSSWPGCMVGLFRAWFLLGFGVRCCVVVHVFGVLWRFFASVCIVWPVSCFLFSIQPDPGRYDVGDDGDLLDVPYRVSSYP